MSERRRVRQEIFSKADSRFFGRCVGFWVASVVVVSLISFWFDFSLDGNGLVETVEGFVPSIQKWSQASSNYVVFRAVWVYMVVSSPFLIFYVLANVRRVYLDRPVASLIIYTIFFYLLAATFFDASIFGMDLADPSESRRYKMFAGSIPGGLMYSLVFGAGFVGFSVIAILVYLDLTGIGRVIRKLKDGK